MRHVTIVLLLLCFVGLTSKASAGIFVPAGLNPGDTYQLAFVTQDSRNGTSSVIADYNAFVQAQAALNPSITGTDVGVQWSAIVSTALVAARDNAPVTAPVYLFSGTLISTAGPTIYSGTLLAPINVTQFVVSPSDAFVWTGSTSSGIAKSPMGGPATVGLSGASTGLWADATASAAVTLHPLYAMSEVLTVAAAVPEPGSIAIWGLLLSGGVACACLRRRTTDSRR